MLRLLTLTLGLLMASQAMAEGLPRRTQSPSQKFDPIVPREEGYSWTGLYFGVDGGYQIGANQLDYSTGGASVANIDGLSTDWFIFGGRLGYDFQIPKSVLVLGVFGGYSKGEAEFGARFGPNIINATIDPNWYVGVRAGYVLRNTSLLYVGYVYQLADLDVTGTTLIPIHKDLKGHGLVVGLENPISQFVTLGIEASYTRYDDVTVWTSGVNRLDLDADNLAVKGRVTFRTGQLFQ